MKEILLRYIIIGIFSFLFILSCSDKNHSITYPQFEGNFEFQSFTVDSIVSGTSYTTSPKLGDHNYLYSGSKNNYHCEFTLIDFTFHGALTSYPEIFANPNTVDSMMLKIYLSDESEMPIPAISLTYLHSANDSIFDENKTIYSEFDPNGFLDTIDLGVFQLTEEDTNSTINSIELIIKDTDTISDLFAYSDDTSKCFLLSSIQTSDFIKMYSSDIPNNNYKPKLYVYYTVIDSTDSSYVSSLLLPVLQDVTLIDPSEVLNLTQDSDYLHVGGSIFRSILHFDLNSFYNLPDQFVLTEDSYLYLNTPFQGESELIAFPLLDSIPVGEVYPVDIDVGLSTEIENGKLKIGIQSYLQYALTHQKEYFGIRLQGNNHFSTLFSIEKPDSGFSKFSITYVPN